jgi:photosystem II stability/assembly factor-like uncharacterized protein
VPAAGVWEPVDTGWKDRGSRLHSISFADASSGVAIGWLPQPTAAAAAHVVATADGGKQWEEATLAALGEGAAYNAINSPSPGEVWGVGDLGSMASSSDNGMRWTNRSEMKVGLQLKSVCFADARNGWAVGSQLNPAMKPATYTAVVLHTTDGGSIWKEQTLSVPPKRAAGLLAVYFADAQHGWAVGGISDGASGNPLGGRGLICRTADGGKTWQTDVLPEEESVLAGVAGTDASHCWAVCPAGFVAYTDDGGASWSETRVAAPASGACFAIAFADNLNGWVGGQNTLLRTSDGGKTWAAELSETQVGGTFNVYALCCPGDGSAWACGDTRIGDGTIGAAVWHYVAK